MPLASHPPQDLTRRANHRHIFNIARIQKPAAKESGRGLFQSSAIRISLCHRECRRPAQRCLVICSADEI
jgi:hypothetical protein